MRFSRNKVTNQIATMRVEAEKRDAMRRAAGEGIRYLEEEMIPDKATLLLLPEDVARRAGVAVVGKSEKDLIVVALTTKGDKTKEAIESLKKQGFKSKVFITTKSTLDDMWNRYGQAKSEKGSREEISSKVKIDSGTIDEVRREIKSREDATTFFEKINEKTPTSTLLGYILGGALALRASDIHMEHTSKEESLLRFRIDGTLRDITKFSEKHTRLLVSRVKLLAGLKLNVKNAPQDGRFTIENPDGDMETRASVVPAEFGEAIVMRVLDPRVIAMELKDLGLRKDDEEIIGRELSRPNGMILVTGPTGSGKTTSLYAFLKKLQSPEIKIITIEDPIEYHIKGIEQTQANESSNYTFALGLRSILRQDPDVILVGEIRDEETAAVSVDAALTGHLVLSTLHTNNASGAIPRLIDLGIKPQTIGPAISLVMAQRLVRRLCVNCRRKMDIDEELKKKIDKFMKGLPKKVSHENMEPELYESKECSGCEDGFMGRIAITELLEISDVMDELIRKNATERDIENMAIGKQGMVLMQKDGILKALHGVTTLSEVERVTGPLEW